MATKLAVKKILGFWADLPTPDSITSDLCLVHAIVLFFVNSRSYDCKTRSISKFVFQHGQAHSYQLLLLEDNRQKQQRLCVGASVRLCVGGETMKGPAVQPPIPPPPPLPLPPVAIFIYRSSKPCSAFDH